MDIQGLLLVADQIEATPFQIPGASGTFLIQILNESQDRGVVTSIVHLPPGGRIPAHRHQAGAEMHFILEGDLIEAGRPITQGGFLTHAAGQVHGPPRKQGRGARADSSAMAIQGRGVRLRAGLAAVA